MWRLQNADSDCTHVRHHGSMDGIRIVVPAIGTRNWKRQIHILDKRLTEKLETWHHAHALFPKILVRPVGMPPHSPTLLFDTKTGEKWYWEAEAHPWDVSEDSNCLRAEKCGDERKRRPRRMRFAWEWDHWMFMSVPHDIHTKVFLFPESVRSQLI